MARGMSGAIPTGRTRSQSTADTQAGSEPTRDADSMEGATAVGGTAPWDGAAAVRGQPRDILNTYETIAAARGLTDVETAAVAARERITAAFASDMAVFAGAMPAVMRSASRGMRDRRPPPRVEGGTS